MMKNNLKNVTLTLLVSAMALSLAGCGSAADEITYNDDGKPVISIMTSAFSSESASDDASVNPVMARIEDELGVDLRIRWAISGSYDEKVTATMGAGTYPQIMKIQSKNSTFIANCRGGNMWEIGEKIKDAEKYPNLSKSNADILNNLSVDGKVYSLYSSRDLGRYLVMIREDWLENVGLEYPKTLADFGEMCKRFTENDPDGNGKDDTFGMIMTSYINPIDTICVWAGAPNGYGMNEETGRLEPAYYFEEYLDGLKFVKSLYDNGYMNKNWATMDPERWNEFFLNGNGGVIIDVGSRAKKLARNINELQPNAKVGVFGSVAPDENSQRRVLPTTGYSGYFVFPKAAIKNEEELDLCLKLMDKMCDPTVSDYIQYGMQDVHYEIVDGEYRKKTGEGGGDVAETNQINDLNQMLTFITNETNLNIPYESEVAERCAEVVEDNAKYCVFNPAEPFISETYSLKGAVLDSIMEEANTKFINGVFTEDDWKAALESWKSQGGEKVIEELNEQYFAIHGK